jgi:hypothetical protein
MESTLLTYKLERVQDGFRAECMEMDIAAEAPTMRGAVEALRMAIVEKLTEPMAVAPPSKADVSRIVLEPAGVVPSK